jgi:REP element-mobilizing transposase RayT
MGAHDDRVGVYLVTLWTYGGKPLFAEPEAAMLFCRVLASLRQRLGFRLHAYVVLPDRVRLIMGANDRDPRWVQVVVQRLKSRFARETNSRSGRLGLVWQDAEQRAPLPAAGDLARRVDLLHRAPVIARLARHPLEWRYSSYRAWTGMGRCPAPVDLPEGSAAGGGLSG